VETWKCHVCGEERPDDCIAVLVTQKDFRSITFTQNVRYCLDRVDCAADAHKVEFLEGMEED
jgi:hypothetical protein